jgi:hypothetical protein
MSHAARANGRCGRLYGFWNDDFGPSRLQFSDLPDCELAGDPVVLLAERRVM